MSPTRSIFALAFLAGCGGSSAGPAASGPNGGNATRAATSCPVSPAPALFDHALCLCGDLDAVAAVHTHAPAGGAASVGVNGNANLVGHDDIEGTFTAYQGLSGVGSATVRDDVSTIGDVRGVGALSVGHDLSVGGDLQGVGAMSIGGTLRVQGQRQTLGLGTVGATGPYSAPAGPPCACDPSSFLDVAKKVAEAKTQNDNAAHQLPTSLATIGLREVTLPTGSYYFSDVATIGAVRFTISGVVALYLDGSLDTVGAEQFKVQPGATLDLYVAGAVRTVGALALGGDPSAVRLYVGGQGAGILSVGAQLLGAMIYAPTATVAFVGDTTVHGALFGDRLSGVGLLDIDYAAATSPPIDQCPPAGGGSAGSGGSAGTGGAGTGGTGGAGGTGGSGGAGGTGGAGGPIT